MPKKDRTLTPSLREALYNLRVSGMSERGIYEGLRERLREPPSYRDIRASLASDGVRYRADALRARRDQAFKNDRDPERPVRESDYRARLATVREVDKTPDAKERLDENYIVGYLARAGQDPDSLEDTNLRDSLVSIYEGQGS